jgi:hypothetical protein
MNLIFAAAFSKELNTPAYRFLISAKALLKSLLQLYFCLSLR